MRIEYTKLQHIRDEEWITRFVYLMFTTKAKIPRLKSEMVDSQITGYVAAAYGSYFAVISF